MNNKIKELEEKIKNYKALYYQGRPAISDFEYDKLEDELRLIAPDSHVLQLVGTDSENNKITHQKKMLSLEKTYSVDDLLSWADSKTVVSTFKIDGMSCSLVYADGVLKEAKTRGDGVCGEDILKKVIWIDDVPKKIKAKGSVEVRGELFCRKSKFEQLTIEMNSMGLNSPTSERNIVAGLIGRKEHVELCKYLSFHAFDLIASTQVATFEHQKVEFFSAEGFRPEELRVHKEKETILADIELAKEFMSSGDYGIDGIVFSFDDLELHKILGETAHHPRYKMAFKFAGVTKESVIEELTWQVSRNGVLTPVAEITPVELSGATVARVTLHNYGMVKEHNLKKGDRIEIIRSGEVIPKFLKVVKSSDGEIAVPELCPSCQKRVSEVGIRLICENEHCGGRQLESILHYIKAVGIEDLSDKRVFELIGLGEVNSISSLYDLTIEKILRMNKTQEKLANKIFENIQKSKSVDLITFLSALGLTGGGATKIEKIVQAGHESLEKILHLTSEELVAIEGFAKKSADDFVESLQSKKELIAELQKNGVTPSNVSFVTGDQLQGKTFCITGALSMARSQIEELIKRAGGKVTGSVSKKTSYLVTNEQNSTSSKYVQATKLNLPIISERELLQMLGEENVKK